MTPDEGAGRQRPSPDWLRRAIDQTAPVQVRSAERRRWPDARNLVGIVRFNAANVSPRGVVRRAHRVPARRPGTAAGDAERPSGRRRPSSTRCCGVASGGWSTQSGDSSAPVVGPGPAAGAAASRIRHREPTTSPAMAWRRCATSCHRTPVARRHHRCAVAGWKRGWRRVCQVGSAAGRSAHHSATTITSVSRAVPGQGGKRRRSRNGLR